MESETADVGLAKAIIEGADRMAALVVMRAFRDLAEQVGQRPVTAQDLLKLAAKMAQELDAKMRR